MFGIKALTRELRQMRQDLHERVASKDDLKASEKRIIAAFGDRADPDTQKKLNEMYDKVVSGKDKVGQAIEDNT